MLQEFKKFALQGNVLDMAVCTSDLQPAPGR